MKKILAALIVLGLIAGGAFWYFSIPHTPEEQMKHAQELEKSYFEREGELAKAPKEEQERAVKDVEDDYKKVFEKWEKSELADDSFGKVADFHKKLARKAAGSEKKPEALEEYRKVIDTYKKLEEKIPGSPLVKDARVESIDLYRRQLDDLDNAVKELRRLRKDYPKDDLAAKSLFDIAELTREAKDKKKTITIGDKQKVPMPIDIIKAYDEFLKEYKGTKNPQLPTAEYRVGEYYWVELEEKEEALIRFDRILSEYPESPEAPKALWKRIEYLREKERFEEALAAAKKLLEKYPNSPEAARARDLETELAKKSEAAKKFEKEEKQQEQARYGSGGRPYDIMVPNGPNPRVIFKDIIDAAIDTRHIKIDVTVDPAKRHVRVVADLKIVPPKSDDAKNKTIKQIPFGLEAFLKISKLEVKNSAGAVIPCKQEVKGQIVRLDLEKEIERGLEASLHIEYEGDVPQREVRLTLEPSGGFLLADAAWYPWTIIGDVFTLEIAAHMPEEYTVLAAGKLVGVEKSTDKNSPISVTRWKSEQPLTGLYLAYGRFEKVEDNWNEVKIAFYWIPENKNFTVISGRKYLAELKKILDFYAPLIGDYAYPKLYVAESPLPMGIGGVGSPSLILLSKAVNEKLPIPVNVLAHETSHQWWGDKVPISLAPGYVAWLSEGFASYSDCLYTENAEGRDAMMKELRAMGDMYLRMPFGDVSIATCEGNQANYPVIVYMKGCRVMHTLHWIMGDEPFRKALKNFAREYAYRERITLGDFQRVCRESVRETEPVDAFFKEWLNTPGYPQFALGDVKSVKSEKGYRVTFSVEQINKNLFTTPLEVVFTSDGGKKERRVIQLSKTNSSGDVVVPFNPVKIELDPDDWMLKKSGSGNTWPKPEKTSDASTEKPSEKASEKPADKPAKKKSEDTPENKTDKSEQAPAGK